MERVPQEATNNYATLVFLRVKGDFKMKVFWSWQSDSPSGVNRNFVKDALQSALASVTHELNLTEAERPEVDHDTKDEPGLVEIVATIFKKIDGASVFVGDVTAQLIEALKSNLSVSLAQRDATVEFSLVPARPDERSIWLAADSEIVHQDFFDGPGVCKWTVSEGTRAYIRVAPAGWSGEKPSRREVRGVPGEFAISALGPWWNGDGGANSLGVISVGIDPNRQGCTHALAQWFEGSGEVWGCNSLVTRVATDQKVLLNHGDILKNWAIFLKRSLALLLHFRAKPPFRVEVGVTGLENLIWAAENNDQRSSALLSESFFVRQDRQWDEDAQIKFLTAGYNQLRDAFNQARLSEQQVSTILKN